LGQHGFERLRRRPIRGWGRRRGRFSSLMFREICREQRERN
jgi:hypothetical protein